MKPIFAFSVFVFGAKALIGRDVCCFGLTSYSSPHGSIYDGQNRMGSKLTPAQYCIDLDEVTIGSDGRVCASTCKFPASKLINIR
jgi:hypothetical protein